MDTFGQNLPAKQVGDIANSAAKPLRIIHISDTHLLHKNLIDEELIPDGDVLIHSGDFSFFRFKRHVYTEYDFEEQIKEMMKFFDKLPHKYKIFICGNHETNFPQHSIEEIRAALPGIIYLQDASVEIEGVKFYGTPWCGKRWFSFARSYVVPYSDLAPIWEKIPDDVDVLITHNPPFGIRDLAVVQPWQTLWEKTQYCENCKDTHEGFRHFGCKDLKTRVLSIKPRVHLFGHVHECNGFTEEDGVLFSNAAMKLSDQAHVMDYYRVYHGDSPHDVTIQGGSTANAVKQASNFYDYCNIL